MTDWHSYSLTCWLIIYSSTNWLSGLWTYWFSVCLTYWLHHFTDCLPNYLSDLLNHSIISSIIKSLVPHLTISQSSMITLHVQERTFWLIHVSFCLTFFLSVYLSVYPTPSFSLQVSQPVLLIYCLWVSQWFSQLLNDLISESEIRCQLCYRNIRTSLCLHGKVGWETWWITNRIYVNSPTDDLTIRLTDTLI